MPKRILSGVVVSSNSNKTITVDVTRRIKHKLYKKIIRRTKKYHAHDENNTFNVGDNVSITLVTNSLFLQFSKKASKVALLIGPDKLSTVKVSNGNAEMASNTVSLMSALAIESDCIAPRILHVSIGMLVKLVADPDPEDDDGVDSDCLVLSLFELPPS